MSEYSSLPGHNILFGDKYVMFKTDSFNPQLHREAIAIQKHDNFNTDII